MQDLKNRIEDLPTVYNAQETEERIYKFWEDGEYFKADNKSQKPPFSIVIPPHFVRGLLLFMYSLTCSSEIASIFIFAMSQLFIVLIILCLSAKISALPV